VASGCRVSRHPRPFRRFPVYDVTSAILMALNTRQQFQLSYWDSAIIETSRAGLHRSPVRRPRRR
jgi:hypothetical protein